MRFIDPDDVYVLCSAELLHAAEAASKEVSSASSPRERKQVIASNQPVWSRFKDALADVSYDKCWYCESHELRSDNAVDHFRPKGKVHESKSHPGYWWLAFDHLNYRYACTFCNSSRNSDQTAGGKQDHFPIEDESARAMTPLDDVSQETPLLIDPCVATDVALLWFDDDGMPRMNEEAAALDSNARSKIDQSTKLYHLDHPALTAARRRVFIEIASLCREGDRKFKSRDMTNPVFMADYRATLQKIRQRVKPRREYSAAALCALQGLRANSKTAATVLGLP